VIGRLDNSALLTGRVAVIQEITSTISMIRKRVTGVLLQKLCGFPGVFYCKRENSKWRPQPKTSLTRNPVPSVSVDVCSPNDIASQSGAPVWLFIHAACQLFVGIASNVAILFGSDAARLQEGRPGWRRWQLQWLAPLAGVVC